LGEAEDEVELPPVAASVVPSNLEIEGLPKHSVLGDCFGPLTRASQYPQLGRMRQRLIAAVAPIMGHCEEPQATRQSRSTVWLNA
jgi:hypothetical protein